MNITGETFVPEVNTRLVISNVGIMHITQNGIVMKISDMSDSHLYNSIMKQIRKIEKVNSKDDKLSRIILARHIKEFKKRGFNLDKIRKKLKTI